MIVSVAKTYFNYLATAMETKFCFSEIRTFRLADTSLNSKFQMFEDKETETEMLAGELDRTRDIVSALQDENRELKVCLLTSCLF